MVLSLMILGCVTGRLLMAQPVVSIKHASELSDILTVRAWEQGARPSTLPAVPSIGVVVRNISSFPIAAVMVKAVVLRLDQKVETRWLLRHNFDNSSVLLPGGQYVVSPFGIPIAQALEAGSIDARLQQPVEEALAEARGWKEVSIEVDSVLDTTGRLRGKDSADSFRLFSEWLRADRDLADRLLQVRNRAGGAAEIAQVLGEAKVGTSTSFQNRDHYNRRWSRSAQRLLRQLNIEGPQAVFAEAERRKSSHGARVIFR